MSWRLLGDNPLLRMSMDASRTAHHPFTKNSSKSESSRTPPRPIRWSCRRPVVLRRRRRLVLEGTGWVRVGDERYTVGPQHTVIIPAETPHAWGNSRADVAKLSWAFAGPHPFWDSTYLEAAPPTYAPPERAKTGDSVRRILVRCHTLPHIPYHTITSPQCRAVAAGSNDEINSTTMLYMILSSGVPLNVPMLGPLHTTTDEDSRHVKGDYDKDQLALMAPLGEGIPPRRKPNGGLAHASAVVIALTAYTSPSNARDALSEGGMPPTEGR
jgi:Cupin domain